MDWGFLDIFKKAEFNILMLSASVTGWILFAFFPQNIFVIGIAIFATTYCLVLLIRKTYNTIKEKIAKNKREKFNKLRIENSKKERNVEIERMFNGLSRDSKEYLIHLLRKGIKEGEKENMVRLQSNERTLVEHAQYISGIFIDKYGLGQNCIDIGYYRDSIIVTIDPHLYSMIRKYISTNK